MGEGLAGLLAGGPGPLRCRMAAAGASILVQTLDSPQKSWGRSQFHLFSALLPSAKAGAPLALSSITFVRGVLKSRGKQARLCN